MAHPTAPAPSHLFPVALLLLLWHGVLAADYVIDRFALGSADWPALMAALPLDALWLRVVWALGVWLGLAAAFFLALRDDASVLLFFAAAGAEAALVAGLMSAGAAAPDLPLPLPLNALLAALVLVPLLGWIYARALNRAGALH